MIIATFVPSYSHIEYFIFVTLETPIKHQHRSDFAPPVCHQFEALLLHTTGCPTTVPLAFKEGRRQCDYSPTLQQQTKLGIQT